MKATAVSRSTCAAGPTRVASQPSGLDTTSGEIAMTNRQDRRAESQTLARINDTPAAAADHGWVRLGQMAPTFPRAREVPTAVSDQGKVRMGLTSPMFPPARSK
jgi:hypothetical protein